MGVGVEHDMPEVETLMTCLDVGSYVRYSLHDTFRALPFVPKEIFVFIEWRHEEAFRFRLKVEGGTLDRDYESDEISMEFNPSGRSESVLRLPVAVARLLPGSYNLVVVHAATGVELRNRRMFFGEM